MPYRKVKSDIIQAGEVTALGFGCDVASEEAVQATIKQVESELGLVDTLVTAAGKVPVSYWASLSVSHSSST